MPSFKFTQSDLKLTKRYGKQVILFLKLMITIGMLLVLFRIFQKQLSYNWINIDWLLKGFIGPFVIIMLMFGASLNWILESYKWRLLISPKEKLNFNKSMMAVLSGIPFGLITPGRIGEFGGRIWFAQDKVFATIATFCGNLTQLGVTLLIGGYAWFQFRTEFALPISELWTWKTWGLLLFSLLILIGVWRRYGKYWLKYLSQIRSEIWLKSFVISFLRYLSFGIPFGVLLILGYPELGTEIIWMIPLTYFIQALLPVFALAEIGLRAATLGMIAEHLGLEPIRAIQAGILIYLFNVILPALIGLLIIWRLRPSQS